MSTVQFQQVLRGILPRRQNTDEVHDLSGGLALERTRACELGDVGDPWPIDIKIGTQLLAHFDDTALDAPTLPIQGLSLLELSVWIGKIGSQIGLQCRLVAFDDKERIPLMRTQEVPELAVGVQSIKSADPPSDGERGKQLSSFRNLIRFFAYRHLGPDFLALMSEAGKQMRRVSFSRSGSSHRFAIDGEGIGGSGLAGGPDPC